MNYAISEIHIDYLDGEIKIVAVLWQSGLGWVRASYCTTKPCSGYKQLQPNEKLSDQLIQDVAGKGMNLPDNLKKKYFPGKRNWEK